jgi:hypothetical protein
MTPPAGPGQAGVLKTHYERIGGGPVAYLDETYHVEKDGRPRFYAMAAVVVLEPDRDALRNQLDQLVPEGFWHTTDRLRTPEGRAETRTLLESFQVPEETCVIVDKVSVDDDDDKEGTRARGLVLGRLLSALQSAEHATHPPVSLTVIEEHRIARINNFDRSVRSSLIKAGTIAETMTLASVSPGSEHLLWLPDLACSAYRQKTVNRRTDLFDIIEDMTHVVRLP